MIGGGELVKSSPTLDVDTILVVVEPTIPKVANVHGTWLSDRVVNILVDAELETSAPELGLVSQVLEELTTPTGFEDPIDPAGLETTMRVDELFDPAGFWEEAG